MKKVKKILLVLILLIGIVSLTGCSLNQIFCKHEFNIEEVEPTCKTEGYVKKTCPKCGLVQTTILPKLDHDFTNWEKVKEATAKEDGLEERVCKVCGEKETRVIQFINFLNTSILEFNPDFTKTYTFNDIESLQVVFDSAMFNNSKTLKVVIKFDNSNLQTLLDTLVNNSTIKKEVKVGMKSSGNNIEFSFDYSYINPTTSSTSKNKYKQYNSVNLNKITKTRSDDYNDFLINKKIKSYEVKTTDQLVYVVERGYKPIINDDNTLLIYNKALDILRNIINDDMSDIDKVKAIHDYIIMNTTYDKDLLTLGNQNRPDLNKYNGFYLEGVFNDKRAVCDGISKAVSLLCNIEGIPCIQITGKNKNNPNGVGHAWNKVYVDNNWYILDATSDGTIINGEFEILSYEYFLVSDEKMNDLYIADNYNNIKCDKVFNIYRYMKYNDNNDYSIQTKSELKDLIRYVNSLNIEGNYTVQILYNFDIGADVGRVISEVVFSLGIKNIYSYVCDGPIITIIKDGE